MTTPPMSSTRQRERVLGGTKVVLIDSVTEVTPGDAEAVVVTGSHGGASVAGYALEVRTLLYVFNDAGIGKNAAGCAALPRLQTAGQAAVTVDCASARIGEAADTLRSGTVSHANEAARSVGFRIGDRLSEAIERMQGAKR